MESIFKTVTNQSELAIKLGDAKIADTDVWRDVGGYREQDQFNMRLLALTKPSEYAGLKANAITGVKEATENSYSVALKQHLAAGVSMDDAKSAAKKAAFATKDLQMKAMKMRFPDADSQVYQAKTVRDASAFVR
jgi:hypothetical protein